MSWLLFALATAFSESFKDLFSKLGLKKVNEYLAAWILMAMALPLLAAALLITGIPALGRGYLPAILLEGSLNTLAVTFYMRAIKSSDLSTCVPMISFSPLFLLFISPLLVGEFPSAGGLIGVVLIVAGSYLLHIHRFRQGITAPFWALFEEKGPRYMMLVAFLWSITAVLDKIGVQNSSPLFWAFSMSAFLTLFMLPVVIKTTKKPLSTIKKNYRLLLPIGIFQGLAMISQMTALDMTLVAYVVSIKRTSIALSVVWGAVLLGERNIREKLFGVLIMLIGVSLIAFA
jgi:uncharacterized membrane protein